MPRSQSGKESMERGQQRAWMPRPVTPTNNTAPSKAHHLAGRSHCASAVCKSQVLGERGLHFHGMCL